MKLLNPLIGAVLLAALSGSALAELKLIKREEIVDHEKQRDRGEAPVKQEGYLKLVADDGRSLWVTLISTSFDLKTISYFLQIENFYDGGSSRRVEVDKRLAPDLVPSAPQQSLPAVGSLVSGKWNVIKLNKELTKVEKTSELKSMLLVTKAAKIGDKYIVGGMSKGEMISHKGELVGTKDQFPVLVKLNKDLKIEREVIVRSQGEGRVTNIFVVADRAFAIMAFAKAIEIWELSPDLAPLKKIKLPGGLAQGIPLRDGGFAVTYTTPPDRDIFIERFNSSGQSVWKKKVLTKSMPFADPMLCELQDGFGLVVGNNNRLLVARIDTNSQRVRIVEDMRSGLTAPSRPAQYLIGVQDNNIHIRGVAYSKNATSEFSFHFIETP